MNRLFWGLILLLLLAGTAVAGQSAPIYYVSNVDWTGSNEASLPHYRSPGQTCVTGILRKIVRGYQVSDPSHLYSYRAVNVGPDDGFSNFVCQGVIEELYAGNWVTVEPVGGDNAAAGQFGPSDPCPSSALVNSDTSQCGQPKCPSCAAVGNPIDPGTGNKHQVETDYVGAGAFPLRFQRTYDSYRTWYNNPVPIGIGWTHSYLAGIDVVPAPGSSTLTIAYLYRPDGTFLTFTLQGSVWTPDNDVPKKLSVTTAVDPGSGLTYYVGASLIDDDDTVETFDAVGRLASITNRDGLTQTVSYIDGSGNLSNDVQQVTDPEGHTLTFGYNSNGELASLTDGNGAITRYNYDTNNNLSSVVYPDLSGTTKTRTYAYNEANQVAGSWPNSLTGIIDENDQRYASWGYDLYGRAILSVHGAYLTGTIDKTTLAFNSTGTTSFTDALGQTRTYGFNVQYEVAHPSSLDTVCSACTTNDQTDGYDTNGYPSTRTDFDGNSSTFDFTKALDSNGHPRGLETQRVEGIPPTGSTNTAEERTISTQWDANFRVPDQRTIVDSTSTTESLTNWIYNSRGQPTFRCEVDPAAGTTATNYLCGSLPTAPVGVRQWAWTYCNATSSVCPLIGLMLTSADPLNHVTTYAYYTNKVTSGCATVGGACYYPGDLKSIKNAAQQVTTYTSYDLNGRPTRITDFNGVPTDLTYHPRGWLTQRAVRGATSATDQITSYTHDGVGQVTRVTLPDASYLVYTYDIAHRLYNIVDNVSIAVSNNIHYKLDAAGNRIEDDTYDPTSTVTNPKNKVIRAYNKLGQLANTQNANSTASAPVYNAKYGYDPNGNLQQITDGLTPAHISVNTYDPLNRLAQAWQDKCVGTNCSNAVNAKTDYSYDARDRLTQVQDPFGLTTYYKFDGLSNQTQLTSPDTGVTGFKYDALGNLANRTDARSTSVNATYVHDALNRVTSVTYPSSTTLNVSYRYDTYLTPDVACPTGDTYSIGRLTHFTDASGRTQFCYDRFGNMVWKSQVTSGQTFTTQYSYDPAHRVSSITTPQLTLIAYTRDPQTGHITGVTATPKGQATQTVVSKVTYYPFGPVASVTYGNGRVLTLSYDQDYVIGGISDPGTGGLALTFGRDVMGDLTKLQIGGSTSAVGNILIYDGLYRLTGVTDLTSIQQAAYTYDSTGNRLTKQGLSTSPVSNYTYDTGNHWLMAAGPTGSAVARGYDKIGDTTSIGSSTSEQNFYYDATARMTQMSVGSVSPTVKMQYLYNARGERVQKYLGTTTTSMTVYDESGHVLGDYTSATAPIREMIWMDDLPVGVLSGATPTLASIEADQIGTPRMAINAAGTASVWAWSPLNDPFGETQPTNPSGSNLVLNQRFPGQVWDSESGLNYNYRRDYDSSTGRYVESDPIGLKGGISTYAYARSTPLVNFDRDGLCVKCKKCEVYRCSAALGDPSRPAAWDEVAHHYSCSSINGKTICRGLVLAGITGKAILFDEQFSPSLCSLVSTSCCWAQCLRNTWAYGAPNYYTSGTCQGYDKFVNDRCEGRCFFGIGP